MRRRSWTDKELKDAAKTSFSYRAVIKKLGLKPAGGNYAQVKKYIKESKIDTSHFKGMGWNAGLKGIGKPKSSLREILKKNSSFQSFKLKKRLFSEGLRQKKCEKCGWHEISADGRLPLELDHINGDSKDNRLENLRILCPNCHSLQLTHRGKNIKR